MGIALFLGARRLPGWPTPAAWVMRLDTKVPASVPAASILHHDLDLGERSVLPFVGREGRWANPEGDCPTFCVWGRVGW